MRVMIQILTTMMKNLYQQGREFIQKNSQKTCIAN